MLSTESARVTVDEVAEPVEDRAAAVDLDAAENVRVVGGDDVGAGIDRGVRDIALVLRETRAHVADALVQRDDDDVCLLAQRERCRPASTQRLSGVANV